MKTNVVAIRSSRRPRLDRNGIPILDPPHEANKLPPTPCKTPEDHDWGAVRFDGCEANEHGIVVSKHYQICKRCFERYEWTEVS